MERRGGTRVGVRNRLGRADHNTKVEKNTTEQEEQQQEEEEEEEEEERGSRRGEETLHTSLPLMSPPHFIDFPLQTAPSVHATVNTFSQGEILKINI